MRDNDYQRRAQASVKKGASPRRFALAYELMTDGPKLALPPDAKPIIMIIIARGTSKRLNMIISWASTGEREIDHRGLFGAPLLSLKRSPFSCGGDTRVVTRYRGADHDSHNCKQCYMWRVEIRGCARATQQKRVDAPNFQPPQRSSFVRKISSAIEKGRASERENSVASGSKGANFRPLIDSKETAAR